MAHTKRNQISSKFRFRRKSSKQHRRRLEELRLRDQMNDFPPKAVHARA